VGEVREVLLEGADVPLSALLAAPDDAPRGIIAALPGGGMRASYFHGHADPSLSLLTVGAALGWLVVALDRPGYGESATYWPRGLALPEQAGHVRAALAPLVERHRVPIALVGHSHGMKVSMQLAADEPDERDGGLPLLSLDLTGSAIRYHPDVLAYIGGGEGPPPGEGRALFWGDDVLYPPGTFDRALSPVVAVPQAERDESPSWPDVFPLLAPKVRVPVRFRVAEHERWWEADETTFAEMRAAFTSSPNVDLGVQPSAGHNISLGWAARAWHLGAIAFAEQALLSRPQ
jgi:pimeloyl-ACP methyl ester carboxylesterase